MDYGTDLYLDENRDVVFTTDGDVQLASGARLVAQDIREALSIHVGAVTWDKEAGSTLLDQLNSELDVDLTVCNELERVALADPRVDASTVVATRLENGTFRLAFAVIGELDEVQLLFDLEDLMGGLDG